MATSSRHAYRCSSRIEASLRAQGFAQVAGIDEAGRGSLFGAVYAAVVILGPDHAIRGLDDSKLLAPAERHRLAPLIKERSVAWAVAAVDAGVIDSVNIYQASRLAMRQAVESLGIRPDYLLVDAMKLDLDIPQRSLIKGDARCHAIAAASILAKVHRDRAMEEWSRVYPEYGLDRHKGYLTPEHRTALDRFGITPLHRMSFEPVKSMAREGREPRAAQLALPFTSAAQS